MATLNLSLTVPNDKAQDILDAFAKQHGYDEASGLSKVEFMKREVVEFVRSAYVAEKTKSAEQAARAAALAEANSVPIT